MVRIRSAKLDEIESLSLLAVSSKASWGYDAVFMAQCRSELVVNEDHVVSQLTYVAVDENSNELLGFYLLKELGERDAELDMLFVAPQHIGEGVGRALLLDAQGEARRRGWKMLLIESDPCASSFYERQGAVLVGTAKSPSTGRDLPLYELRL
jgi:GNAT superfamily N-acetyltransferase